VPGDFRGFDPYRSVRQWGQLTDDDLSEINGNRDQLEGVIQERYAYGKDRAKEEVDS
jgi:uncharacterized protein YjbJ (UPF0337 family)